MREPLLCYRGTTVLLPQAGTRAESSAGSQANFVANPLLLGKEPVAFVFQTLKKIKSSDLEQALILLPFNDAVKVLGFCERWLEDPMETEFTCRIVMTLVKIHLDQIQQTHRIKSLLTSLKEAMKPSLGRIKSILGTNTAAITFLRASRTNEAM